MISCRLVGGLGNQLFQIFTTIAYALEHNCPFIFLNQFQLNTGSNGETIRYSYWTTFLSALRVFLRENISGFELYKEPEFTYNKLSLDNINNNNIVLLGYFQSYKYFEKYKETISRLIKIPTLKVDLLVRLKSQNIISNINLNNTISMHFRLGDYKLLPDQYVILPLSYYRNALATIINNTTNTTNNTSNTNNNNKKTVLYFCEQSELTEVNNMISILKNEFNSNLEFVTIANKQLLDWEEMLLMSCCQYNIIANSSFSWWGAYLNSNNTNTNNNKIICYPDKWFGPAFASKNNTKDMFPPTWNSVSFS